MRLRIERGENHLVSPAIRHVIDTLPSFILHDIALKIDFCQIHRWEQKTHSVGIEPQCQRQRVGWQSLVVVCPVFGR